MCKRFTLPSQRLQIQSPLQPGSAHSGTLLCCPRRTRLPTSNMGASSLRSLNTAASSSMQRPTGSGPRALAHNFICLGHSRRRHSYSLPSLRPLQEAPPDPLGAVPLPCVVDRRWPRVPSFGSISESNPHIAHLQLTQRRLVDDSSIRLPGNVARVPCSLAIPAPGQNGVEVTWGRPVLSHKSPHSLRLLWEGPPHV